MLLFCGSIPNFAESVIALLRGLLSFINLGWIGTLLIISRVLLILGGTALSVIGAIFMGVLNNGMSILGIDQNWQRTVKGLVLLAAVIFDVMSKNRKQSA